jgi:DNA-binding response OmpR family regulator
MEDWVIYLDLGGSGEMDLAVFGMDGMGIDPAPDPESAMKMALSGHYKAIVLNAGAEAGKALLFLSRLREKSRAR